MLNKQENKVMEFVYEKCQKKGTCLLSTNDIISAMYPLLNLTEAELNEILNNLVLENYITLINSDKKGIVVYCITLTSKGEAFQRDKIDQKKSLGKRLMLTIIFACISFIVGLILKAIFS